MKIGLFSGSFDPIHTGHAIVANYISQYCGLDKVWVMPSPLNPLKVGTSPAEPSDRVKMCELVARKCHNVEVSQVELSLPLPSYTWRTLCHLREKYPEHEFHLIIGSDNWQAFHRWRNYEDILREFSIIIYPRPGYECEDKGLPDGVSLLKDPPQTLISSTFIREAAKEKRNLNYFLDADVIDYIKSRKLYE